ncbi:hypothetical protein O3P69_004937 [Scylla paramamosain]|uniref:Uncharacterized protein n=1 Tax=Scylla paramamosain TaxID=85552 RepID=A0AAW0U939_SCYPA
MTKPSFEKPIDSLQDLLEANKFGFVPAAQAGTSNEYLLKTAQSGIFKALWEMTEPSRSFPKSGHEAMEKVLTDDIVYMSANLNSEIRASQKGRHRFHLARNTFFPQGYGIACFPGAPFKTKFSIILAVGLTGPTVR